MGMSTDPPRSIDHFVDGMKQAFDFLVPGLAIDGGGGTPRCFGNDRVEVLTGKSRARKNPLVVEEHIAGKENRTMFVDESHAGGPGDMAGREKGDFDFVGIEMNLPRLTEGHGKKPGRQSFDLTLGEKRILGNSEFFPLTHHHIDRVAQHPGRQGGVGDAGQDPGFRMVAEDDGQRSR